MNQAQDERPKRRNGLPRWFNRSALIHVQNSLFPSWNKDDLWSRGDINANHRHREQGMSTMRCCLIAVIIGAIAVGLFIGFVFLLAEYSSRPVPYDEMTAEAIREYNQGTEPPYWVTATVTP